MKVGSFFKHSHVTYATEKSVTWLRSKHAIWIFAAISFAESVFAPIIIDPFLIALIFARRELWKRFIVIAIIFSVLGGIAGYALGALFFDTIGTQVVSVFGLEENFAETSHDIDANGFIFVLIGAFTPIPYKIVAIASGLLHINLLTFLTASLIGRFFRLGLVGYAAYKVGPHTLPLVQRNLHIIAAVTGVILVGYILLQLL